MIRVFMLAFLLVLPVVGLAQPVTLRTGEHDSFTRVVLEVSPNPDWQMGRDPQGYVLRIAVDRGYDLSGFFDLIPRDRIAAVSQRVDRGELLLRVDCLCHAVGYLFRPDLLVIDVRDGPPPRISTFELSLPSIDRPQMPLRQQAANPAPPPYRIAENQLLPLVFSAEPMPIATAPPQVFGPAQPPPISDETLTDLAALEDMIVQGLGQGLSSGALDGAIPGARDELPEFEDISGMVGGFPGLTARSNIDVAAVSSSQSADVTQAGKTCHPDRYFAVADWGDERPFNTQIRDARRALVGEFDRPNEDAVLRLARLYIRFGFGAEAQQALALDNDTSQERFYLDQIARIIDEDPVDAAAFQGQISCPSAVALWAFLTMPDDFDARVDRTAVLRNFKTFPPALQRHLAPRLAERFLTVGDADAAKQILGDPAGQAGETAAAALAGASLSEALGEPDAASNTVRRVATTDPRVTPLAMTRFFMDGISNATGFTDADFQLADALRFEFAGAPEVPDLTAAQIRAYVSQNQFAQAFALLDAADGQFGAAGAASLRGEVFAKAVDHMENAAFLRLALSDDLAITDSDTILQFAGRLIDLGFAPQAQQLLQRPELAVREQERAYLNAQAALVLDQPDAALFWVAGMDTAQARGLAEQARDQLAAQSVQFPQPSVAGDAPAAPEVDLRAPLEAGRRLLEQSAQSRRQIDDLLAQDSPTDF